MPPWRLAIISCQLIIDTCISTRLDRDIGRGAPSCAAFDRTTTVRKKVPALPPFGGILYQDHLRRPADEDVGPSGPGPFFFEQFAPPVLLDHVPPSFPRSRELSTDTKGSVLRPANRFRMTGSNLLLMDRSIKESLAGQVSTFSLNTLTLHEIRKAFGEADVADLLFRGGARTTSEQAE